MSQWHNTASLSFTASEPPNLLTEFETWPTLGSDFERMMYADTLTYLPDDVLVKVDRAAMAVSLEAREPLLDHRLFAFGWSLPVDMRVADGNGKRLLKSVLFRHVPEALVERPKKGFSVPMAEWLRGPLRPWAEELLSTESLGEIGCFNVPFLRQVWESHSSSRADWSQQLWNTLMLASWLHDRKRGGRVA